MFQFNRYKFRIVFIIISITAVFELAQGQIYWKRVYNRSWNAFITSTMLISKLQDGNYFLVRGWKPNVLKVNQYGDTILSKDVSVLYGYNINIMAMTNAQDGNVITAGLPGDSSIFLMKLNVNGDTIWTKRVNDTIVSRSEFGLVITSTRDSNFIIGWVSGYNGNNTCLMKITTDGKIVWRRTYIKTIYNFITTILSTQDGGCIVAGYIGGNADTAYLLKTNANGDSVLEKRFNSWHFNGISPTSDGNFIVVGWGVMKISPNLDSIWSKQDWQPVISEFYSIIPTNDGNYLLTGYDKILKMSNSGNQMWYQTFYGKYGEESDVVDVAPTTSGDFIAAGIAGARHSSLQILYPMLYSIIDDRYAYKNIPFTFKIPVSGDSTKYTYAPLKIPAGITVSAGGTISWTPTTDSVYMDHVEFAVSNGTTINDTLTFNIFVNNKNAAIKEPYSSKSSIKSSASSSIIVNSFPSHVSFTLSFTVKAASLAIYDIRGNLVSKLTVVNNSAVWTGAHAPGRYFAKVTGEKGNIVKPFVVVR